MLVCRIYSSVFVREKCWIPTFLLYKHGAMTTTYQHFSFTHTELWLPHTNISPLQTWSYEYHIPTFVCGSHSSVCKREMLVCGSHSSVCKREMLVCGSHSSVFVREKCWYVVAIAVFVREKCWYYQHFSLTNTELWLPHTNISPL
jgi:hypothetical protein